jgi:hypothetical protein
MMLLSQAWDAIVSTRGRQATDNQRLFYTEKLPLT